MQRMPVNTRFASEGFGGSKFTPMRSIGGSLGPVRLAQDNGGPTPTPTPTPAPAPTPNVIVRPAYILPPVQPTYVAPEPQIVAVGQEESSTEKTLITVAAAIGLVALGAVLF